MDEGKGPEHDPIIDAVKKAEKELEQLANRGFEPGDRKLRALDDFYYDAVQDKYWRVSDGALLNPEAVDALVPMQNWVEGYDAAGKFKLLRPSAWLKRIENDHVVEGSTWWPSEAKVIRDVSVGDGGVTPSPGDRLFNLYKPPCIEGGDAAQAEPWKEHVRTLFPEKAEHEHLFRYAAHMVQRPEEKCNHAIVLLGKQGIGKNLLLEPLLDAVGRNNAREIEPDNVFDQFNSWKRSVAVVINEARPTSDEHRQTEFYEKLKPLAAAPPHTLPVNEKHQRAVWVMNRCRVFITTNHSSSIHIPPDDRRMFVLRSMLPTEWAPKGYFIALGKWIEGVGSKHVAAFLRSVDLSDFNPGAEPPKTAAWNDIVGTWRSIGDGDAVAEAMRELRKPKDDSDELLPEPDVVFSKDLLDTAIGNGLDTKDELRALTKGPRKLERKMENLGYDIVGLPKGQSEWRYKKGGKEFRCSLAFVKQTLSVQGDAARELVNKAGWERWEKLKSSAPSAPSTRISPAARQAPERS